MSPSTGKYSPLLWLLLGDKMGDNAQALALERRLGVTAVHKSLRYRAAKLPNPLKGKSLSTLISSQSDPLEPPWPDMVIATGRRSVPVAQWIKKQSGGKARLVQVGRPRASSSLFDLVITTPQYRVASSENVLELPVPFTPLDRRGLDQHAEKLPEEWQSLPKPRIAVLVGGESSTSHIGPDMGERLGREASRLAEALGGSLMVLSGRRTLPETMTALARAITGPSHVHLWRKGAEASPYAGVLGCADAVIVTTDSASMLADALSTGKPVMIFEVPAQARRGTDRLADKLSSSAASSPVNRLAHHGWVSLPRRMDHLVDGLSMAGLVHPLERVLIVGSGLPPAGPLDEVEVAWKAAVRRIIDLLS